MEKMIRMMTKQFFKLALSSRESGTFSSKPEMNPKGHASFSSNINHNEFVSKVNAVISLRSSEEIDNQIGTSSEQSRYPHSFF